MPKENRQSLPENLSQAALNVGKITAIMSEHYDRAIAEVKHCHGVMQEQDAKIKELEASKGKKEK